MKSFLSAVLPMIGELLRGLGQMIGDARLRRVIRREQRQRA